jgi:hypothetical protein
MGLKQLLNLAPRRAGRDRAAAATPDVDLDAAVLASALSGPPPLLRPAAIFRQLLFDPAESLPVWARPRPAAAIVDPVSTDAPKPAKRTRRPKANASPRTTRTRPKGVAKPDRGPTDA